MADLTRRICVDKMTPAERAIRAAVTVVEKAGADVRLTDAVILLGYAKESVADFVDGVPRREHIRRAVAGTPDVAELRRQIFKATAGYCETQLGHLTLTNELWDIIAPFIQRPTEPGGTTANG